MRKVAVTGLAAESQYRRPGKLPGFDCRYAARALPTGLGAGRFAPKFLLRLIARTRGYL
jgi:hypothetical protein